MTTFANIAPTIAKLLRLLTSDKPGEIVASVHALRRVLGSANLDLHDLANVVEFAARREAPQVASATADDDDARDDQVLSRVLRAVVGEGTRVRPLDGEVAR